MPIDWLGAATAFGVLVTLGGLIVATLQMKKQTAGLAEQHRLQIILEYTRRYEEVMDLFPKEVRVKGLHNADPSLAKDPEFLHAFLKYTNLCSEEYSFRDKLDGVNGDEQTWTMWLDEMRLNLSSPIGRACLAYLLPAGQYASYDEFRKLVESWTRAAALNT